MKKTGCPKKCNIGEKKLKKRVKKPYKTKGNAKKAPFWTPNDTKN